MIANIECNATKKADGHEMCVMMCLDFECYQECRWRECNYHGQNEFS